MPFPLHKSPRGLLELFRLRTLGSAPFGFAEDVRPTVEVGEFYAADAKLISGGTAAVGAVTGVGLASALQLTGQLRLHVHSGRFIAGAAGPTNLTLSLELRFGTAGSSVIIASRFFPAVNAGAVVGIGAVIPGWVLLPSSFTGGVQLRALASGTAAGADHTITVVSLIDNITAAV